MQVTSYGLFWSMSQIIWHPGKGSKNSFRLLGRIGKNKSKIKIADFRYMQGIYILYDNYGPCYVGLTKKQGLGKRLKDHLADGLYNKWDRFSWFGFNELCVPDVNGVMGVTQLQEEVSANTSTTIGDLEALLIRAIGPKLNSKLMKFQAALPWEQIDAEDVEKYLGRVSSSQYAIQGVEQVGLDGQASVDVPV